MYVYHLFWDTNKTALLYPGNKAIIKGAFETTNRIKDKLDCHMIFMQFKGNALDIESLVKYIENS